MFISYIDHKFTVAGCELSSFLCRAMHAPMYFVAAYLSW